MNRLSESEKSTGTTPDLQISRPMRLHPISLRFIDHTAQLEKPFLDDYIQKSLKQIRVALLLGIFLYSAFAFLDAQLLPEHKHLTWLIRFGFICPSLMLVFIASYHPFFQRIMQQLLTMLSVLGGTGIVLMIVIAPPPVSFSYYAGLILVFIFSYTFVRLRFIWATAAGWLLVVLYEIAAVTFSSTPWPILLNNNFFFISANLIGMLACYSIEYYARRDFFMVNLLKAEQAKVKQANIELERRVLERTDQLNRMNQDLQVQIEERRRTEQEQTRLREQLKQAEKMEAIGNLASGVAHDLNNLLSSLVGYPELLLMDLPTDSPMRGPIEKIRESGQKAADVVQDLLTISRRGATVSSVLSLNSIISEYMRSTEFRQLTSSHPHVEFETRLDANILSILGSAIHVSKAVSNLIRNAAESNLVAGRVTISTENRYLDREINGYERIGEGEYVVLSIADTGVGISNGALAQIFEPFFTMKKMGKSGTGLGMTVVWWAVKDLGGYFDIWSEEGKGTRFELYFPATRQLSGVSDRPLTIDDYRGGESILVVDDVAEQRDIAAGMLGKLGYRVETAASGEEAVTYLKTKAVDILILDMIMDPGIDGCETYRRIVELHPGQKAVIASGFSESERVKELQRLGAGAYVRKPYTMEKIATAVRKELDRKADHTAAVRSSGIT